MHPSCQHILLKISSPHLIIAAKQNYIARVGRRSRSRGHSTEKGVCECVYECASVQIFPGDCSSDPGPLPAAIHNNYGPTCGNLCGTPGTAPKPEVGSGSHERVASHSRQMYIIHQIKSSTAVQRFASRPDCSDCLSASRELN